MGVTSNICCTGRSEVCNHADAIICRVEEKSDTICRNGSPIALKDRKIPNPKRGSVSVDLIYMTWGLAGVRKASTN